MTSFFESVFFQCGRKVQFISKQDAESRVRAILRRDGVKMKAYNCPHCNGWHLAKVKTKRKKVHDSKT